MRGLIIKDIVLLFRNFRGPQLVFFLVPIIPLSQNPQYIYSVLNLMIMLLVSIQLSAAFGYDEEMKFNTYVKGLPVSPQEVVIAKYILCVIMYLLFLIIETIIIAVVSFFTKIDLSSMLISMAVSLLFVTIYADIMIPLLYKFGIASSRYILYGIILIPSFLLPVLGNQGIVFDFRIDQFELFIAGTFLCLLLLTIFSVRFSILIFRNKDF